MILKIFWRVMCSILPVSFQRLEDMRYHLVCRISKRVNNADQTPTLSVPTWPIRTIRDWKLRTSILSCALAPMDCLATRELEFAILKKKSALPSGANEMRDIDSADREFIFGWKKFLNIISIYTLERESLDRMRRARVQIIIKLLTINYILTVYYTNTSNY